MVKKLVAHSLVAQQEKADNQTVHGGSRYQPIPWGYLALIAIGLIAYTTFLLQGLAQWTNFPGYLFCSSPIADSVYFSEEFPIREPPKGVPSAPDADNLNATATQPPKQNLQNGTTLETISGPRPDKGNLPLGPKSEGVASGTATTPSPGKVSVLVGVFIMAYEMMRRDIIWLAYKEEFSDDADFTVRFILGGFKLETWLEGENATHGDLMVLQCPENLNEGKTFAFFSSLPDMVRRYDYVMKTDDDSYVRFGKLGEHLRPFPRVGLYYGYSLPCDSDGPPADFRVGAGYIISWDLVVWIRDSPIPRNNSIGTEDSLVGDWFREGGVAWNRPSSMHLFHDHPEQEGPCARQLSVESILIHKLKTDERWYQVMDFYNASKYVNN